MPENWNLRYKDNLQKLKTGKLDMATEVIKNLNEREKIKKTFYYRKEDVSYSNADCIKRNHMLV